MYSYIKTVSFQFDTKNCKIYWGYYKIQILICELYLFGEFCFCFDFGFRFCCLGDLDLYLDLVFDLLLFKHSALFCEPFFQGLCLFFVYLADNDAAAG